MLVEKLSHILELIHTAQRQSDLYLQDLQRSNSLLTALRSKNKILYERTQTCETWKMRALLRIASNEFEIRQLVPGCQNRVGDPRGGYRLYLDGLRYTLKELEELKKVISSYGKQNSVTQIHLQDNDLDHTALEALTDLITLCPYMNRLELKRNRLSEDAISELQKFVERIDGITRVTFEPATNDLIAHSGNQVRLIVTLEDQNSGEVATTSEVTADLSLAAADDFLSSAAGLTNQTRIQGPEAPATSSGSLGLNQTQLPSLHRGLGGSQSEVTLPRIPSARA